MYDYSELIFVNPTFEKNNANITRIAHVLSNCSTRLCFSDQIQLCHTK